MASIAGSSITFACYPRSAGRDPAMIRFSGLKSASFLSQRITLPSVRLQPISFRVSCAAKAETLEKVCKIVKDQLALAKDATVTGESKFQALGADSLDTVEIVMGIEEAFDISLGEESANKIATVQDAADLVEKLVSEKEC